MRFGTDQDSTVSRKPLQKHSRMIFREKRLSNARPSLFPDRDFVPLQFRRYQPQTDFCQYPWATERGQLPRRARTTRLYGDQVRLRLMGFSALCVALYCWVKTLSQSHPATEGSGTKTAHSGASRQRVSHMEKGLESRPALKHFRLSGLLVFHFDRLVGGLVINAQTK